MDWNTFCCTRLLIALSNLILNMSVVIHNFSRQPDLVSHYLSHKIIFLMFSLNLPSFSLKQTPLVLSAGLQDKVNGLYLSHKLPLNVEIAYTSRYFTPIWWQGMYLGIQTHLSVLESHWQALLAEVRSYKLYRAPSAGIQHTAEFWRPGGITLSFLCPSI